MTDFVSLLPDNESLEKGLAAALRSEGVNGDRLNLLKREPTPYSTTFPCEIVTYQIERGKPRQIFCKYTADIDYTGHGHRGGVGYEIAAYRNILATTAKKFRPKFYGGYTDSGTGQHWLFLEYLSGSLRVGKLNDARAMAKTARWIAQFHVASQQVMNKKNLRFLKLYDKSYYLGWVSRTFEFATPKQKRAQWFQLLRARAEEFLAPLLFLKPAIIHGEYYQHNILFHQGRICPIDWESAAIGEGLIDLASLTDGWEPKIVHVCTNTYVQTRWPEGMPSNFEKIMSAARLYMTLRWVGDDPVFTRSARARGYWTQLRNLTAELERS